MTINNNLGYLCPNWNTAQVIPFQPPHMNPFPVFSLSKNCRLSLPVTPSLSWKLGFLGLGATQGVPLVSVPGKEPPRLGLWWPRVVGGWPGLG